MPRKALGLVLFLVLVTWTPATGTADPPDTAITPAPDWRIETIDDRDRAGVYKSLAFDGAGRPAIAYSSDAGPRLATWNGSTWDLEAIDSAGKGRRISLAFDPSTGGPCVSYTSHGVLYYACKGESSWSRRQIEPRGVTGLNTSLAFDAAGRPAVAYALTGKGGGLRLARYDGSQWRGETIDVEARAHYLSLAFDAEGNPAIAYGDDKTGNNSYSGGVRCARWDGSSWTISTVESDHEGFTGYSTALAFDPVTAQPVIFHTCNVYWIGRLTTGNGDDWTAEDAGKANDGQFAFDSIGTPMLAVTTNGDLYLYTKGDSGWQEELVDARSGEYFKGQPSIAIGPDGLPAIAYHEHHDGVLKFARRSR